MNTEQLTKEATREAVHAETDQSGFTRFIKRIPLHLVIIVLCILWFIPTMGLLVSSFRPVSKIATTGWWTAFNPPLQLYA